MIKIKLDNDIEKKNIIEKELVKFNDSKCRWLKYKRTTDDNDINFLAFNDDILIGGAVGYIQYNWYFLDLLYIDEIYRGKDIGTALIHKIEEFAINNKLTGVRMETWDFQALNFYKKMGYDLFGEIKDCPPGTICYFLSKKL